MINHTDIFALLAEEKRELQGSSIWEGTRQISRWQDVSREILDKMTLEDVSLMKYPRWPDWIDWKHEKVIDITNDCSAPIIAFQPLITFYIDLPELVWLGLGMA